MRRSRLGWLRALFSPPPLRPPGARAEREFAALCIRCGRCVSACPYKSLVPAGWEYGSEAGTPMVQARSVPCYLCMDCPPVCPSGALDPITDKHAVRMGLAEVNPDTCYTFLGVLCRTCVDACPLGEAALIQNGELRPVVLRGCVGCGICEKVCPTIEPAIVVRAATGGVLP